MHGCNPDLASFSVQQLLNEVQARYTKVYLLAEGVEVKEVASLKQPDNIAAIKSSSYVTELKGKLNRLEEWKSQEWLTDETRALIGQEIKSLKRKINSQIISQTMPQPFTAVAADPPKAITLQGTFVKNEAQNPGRVTLAETLPSDPAVGTQVPCVTGIPIFDNPVWAWVPATAKTLPTGLVDRLARDPYAAHLPFPIIRVDEGETDIKVLMEPVALWRIMHSVELSESVLDWRDHQFMGDLQSVVWNSFSQVEKGYPGINLKCVSPAERFRQDWTNYLMPILEGLDPADPEAQGIKRTLRIFNVDFREMEMPDWMYENNKPHPQAEMRRLFEEEASQ